ncbi:MAG: hypothetical protein KY447_06920, partial [Actinobacteria bacterium]|nr:hypothetical protein [Actinomycetota bacterium]
MSADPLAVVGTAPSIDEGGAAADVVALHDHPLPRPLAMPASVDIYDTTLRDGSQQEGLSLTVDDK